MNVYALNLEDFCLLLLSMKKEAQLKIKRKKNEKRNMKLKVNEMRKLNIMSRVKRANEWMKKYKKSKQQTAKRHDLYTECEALNGQHDTSTIWCWNLLNETIAIEIWAAVAEYTRSYRSYLISIPLNLCLNKRERNACAILEMSCKFLREIIS